MTNKEIIKIADDQLKIQVLNQIPTPVIAVNLDMEIIYINKAGETYLNSGYDDIIGKSCKACFKTKDCASGNCCMVEAIREKKTCSSRNETEKNGTIDYTEYYAVPLVDEDDQVIGGLEFILDVNERVLYERKLREQSQTIRQMSTPTIKLWDGVLMLPIVGVIDSSRAQYIMESMLNRISEVFSKVIILDIHGVAAMDTAVANHLIKITKATKLMGCQCIISGISPSVAQTIIQLGIDMHGINTKSNLSDAMAEAFSIMNVKVVECES